MPGSEVQELGRLLRETREQKGATLADAQQATKIRLSFLQALENENYGILPPPFYIRGFIKTYSTYLGLDPRQTVQLFDDLLDGPGAFQAAPYSAPSADSGGQNPSLRLGGLSQGEARLVEASNEKLNLAALPAPTLPGYLADYSGQQAPADSSGESRAIVSGESRAIVPVNPRDQMLPPQNYVLKPVMLPTTKGAFYMPNFVPTVLVIVIVLAAALLIYRGITSAREAEQVAANATATANAYNTPQTEDNTSLTPQPTGANGLALNSPAPTNGVLTPPPFYTPDPAIAALDKTPTAGAPGKPVPSATVGPIVGGAIMPTFGPLPTATPAPPTATPVPPTPTPVPQPITVEVTVGTTDPRGSWMTITVDGQDKIARMAAPGEVFTFTGQKIAVRAGNPSITTVKVNGQPKDYTKPNAGIITHTWFADGHDTIE